MIRPNQGLGRVEGREPGNEVGELATTSLEFEYLHRKKRCEILIGGDDISNGVITLWHVFFNVCLHSRSFPLHADWRKFDTSVYGEPRGNWRWNSNSRHVVASCPSFSRPAARAPLKACSLAKILLYLILGHAKFEKAEEVKESLCKQGDVHSSRKRQPLNLESLLTLVKVRLNRISRKRFVIRRFFLFIYS